MSIQFGEIHNLVRTYQRVLNLNQADQRKDDPPASEGDDRVSISLEARDLQQASLITRREQGSHNPGR